jgi:hypothetical protein
MRPQQNFYYPVYNKADKVKQESKLETNNERSDLFPNAFICAFEEFKTLSYKRVHKTLLFLYAMP